MEKLKFEERERVVGALSPGLYRPKAYGRHRFVSTESLRTAPVCIDRELTSGTGVNPPICGSTRGIDQESGDGGSVSDRLLVYLLLHFTLCTVNRFSFLSVAIDRRILFRLWPKVSHFLCCHGGMPITF